MPRTFVYLFCFVLFFTRLSLPGMNTMWLTLQRASADLFSFGIGSLVILLGFSLMVRLHTPWCRLQSSRARTASRKLAPLDTP